MYDATVFDKIRTLDAVRPRRTGNHRREQRLHPRRHDSFTAFWKAGGPTPAHSSRFCAPPTWLLTVDHTRLPKERHSGSGHRGDDARSRRIRPCNSGLRTRHRQTSSLSPDSSEVDRRRRISPYADVAGRPRVFPRGASRRQGPGGEIRSSDDAGLRCLELSRDDQSLSLPLEQTDFWVRPMGCSRSPWWTCEGLSNLRRKNTLYIGKLRPWQILIPPGVGHGYKVIGTGPAMLVYVTNRDLQPGG